MKFVTIWLRIMDVSTTISSTSYYSLFSYSRYLILLYLALSQFIRYKKPPIDFRIIHWFINGEIQSGNCIVSRYSITLFVTTLGYISRRSIVSIIYSLNSAWLILIIQDQLFNDSTRWIIFLLIITWRGEENFKNMSQGRNYSSYRETGSRETEIYA